MKLVAKSSEEGFSGKLAKFLDINSKNLTDQRSLRALFTHFSIFQWERDLANSECQNLSWLGVLVRAVLTY